MATTFTLIQTVTVGSGGASSIDFTSIPATYTDLSLKVSINAASLGSLSISLNGSTSSFTNKYLEGNGASASSGSNAASGRFVGVTTTTASIFASIDIYIPNYTSTSAYKSYSIDSVTEANGTTAYSDFIAGLWSATPAAINQITLVPPTSPISQYSSASLYGILKA